MHGPIMLYISEHLSQPYVSVRSHNMENRTERSRKQQQQQQRQQQQRQPQGSSMQGSIRQPQGSSTRRQPKGSRGQPQGSCGVAAERSGKPAKALSPCSSRTLAAGGKMHACIACVRAWSDQGPVDWVFA